MVVFFAELGTVVMDMSSQKTSCFASSGAQMVFWTTKTLEERCKHGRKGGDFRRDDHRKEGSCQRRHDSKNGSKSDKKRHTDGENCQTNKQDSKNTANKGDRRNIKGRKT